MSAVEAPGTSPTAHLERFGPHPASPVPGAVRRPDTPIAVVVFAALAAMFSATIPDPDLWGHVRYGLDFWEAGLSEADPYSYLTEGVRWINHEWLAEAAFGLAWTLGGTAGLIALKLTVSLATVGGAYLLLLRGGADALRAGILVLGGGFLLFAGFGTVRPHMFTYLFFFCLLALLASVEGEGGLKARPARLWLVPVILGVWINFHGGVLAGLAVFLLWAGMHLLMERRTSLRLLPVLAVAVAALFVNPYGKDLVIFLLTTGTVARPEIVEWAPIRLVSILGGGYLLLLAASIHGFVHSSKPVAPALVVVFAVTAVTPLLAVRHLSLFVVAVLVLAGGHIVDVWATRSARPGPEQRNGEHAPLPRGVGGAALAGALALVVLAATNLRCIQVDGGQGSYPTEAVALLAAAGVEGNLAVDFNWGQYVLWHLGPRVKVSLDGRRETVYPDDVYAAGLRLGRGVGDWDAILRDPRTDMALFPAIGPTRNLLDLAPGWTRVYADSRAALFARSDTSLAARLAVVTGAAVPAPPPCFP